MSDGFEAMLEERFAALGDRHWRQDWADVLGRSAARRPPLRRRAVAAALVGLALIAAPAFALRGHLVHLFSAREPAPARVERTFLALQAGAPFPWRFAATARKVVDVDTPDGRVAVWAAPVNAGGFCIAVGMGDRDGTASTCDGDRYERLGPWPFSWSKPDDELVGGPFVLVGYALDKRAASVRIGLDDGEHADVPLTWVSAPIDAGFFVLWTERRHWRDGNERFDVAARDASGKKLDEAAVEVGAPRQ
ncbi:MAG TPA: hypothetical protein VE753_08240 [Gaiellaceae bacterium]|jgi:hypothetical protein|nr:hypothetical protein [Gaiellaceae bacterium]